MASRKKLTDVEIAEKLKNCVHWQSDGTKIWRELKFPNFVAAIGFINAMAIIAETSDHHPDFSLFGWNTLRITLSTHDKGGLTELDFIVAEKIDAILG